MEREHIQSREKKKERRGETYLAALFAPSQFPRASSISTHQTRHSVTVGISLPSASTTCKYRSSAMCAIANSPLLLAASQACVLGYAEGGVRLTRRFGVGIDEEGRHPAGRAP